MNRPVTGAATIMVVTLLTLFWPAHAAAPPSTLDSRSDQAYACRLPVRIGMVDTAVDTSHRALRAQRIRQRSFLRSSGQQPSEHGTAVATLLVGEGGLLPDAELFVAAAIEEQPSGSTRLQLAALLQAFDWMAANGVQVVNMSFETQPNGVLRFILDRAAAKGLILMAAAGNGGPTDLPPYPAAHPRVVAVTAVDKNMHVYRHANRGSYVDFAAPGVGVRIAGHGWRTKTGTSFAVPYITAAAALHIAAGVPAEDNAIRAALAHQAHDLGSVGRDDTFGWGFVMPPARPHC